MCAFFLYVDKRSQSSYRREADARREAMRRQEQLEQEEKHNERIYYDAATEQGCLYRLLCCPHFGKITSERIIYSDFTRPVYSDKSCWDICVFICNWIASFWRKKVEQIDYDLVLDVGVEQSVLQFVTNTGTVIIHCSAREDVSVVRDERDKLARAIEARDELQLKSAIRSSDHIECLKILVAEAKETLELVIKKRYDSCIAEKREFVHIFPKDDDAVNTAQIIHVHDVHRPYQVLDDLSYKITKSKNPNTLDAASKRVRDEYLISLTAGDLRVGEEKNILANATAAEAREAAAAGGELSNNKNRLPV